MIQFLYFEGCPNSFETLKNLIEVIDELGINRNFVKIIKIKDIYHAKKLKFLGSPTILLNEKDIFTLEKPKNFNFSCRLYNINGKLTGIIPKYFIKEKIINEFKNFI